MSREPRTPHPSEHLEDVVLQVLVLLAAVAVVVGAVLQGLAEAGS